MIRGAAFQAHAGKGDMHRVDSEQSGDVRGQGAATYQPHRDTVLNTYFSGSTQHLREALDPPDTRDSVATDFVGFLG